MTVPVQDPSVVWIACSAPLSEIHAALVRLPRLRVRQDVCGTAHIFCDPCESEARAGFDPVRAERDICAALEAAGLNYESVRGGTDTLGPRTLPR